MVNCANSLQTVKTSKDCKMRSPVNETNITRDQTYFTIQSGHEIKQENVFNREVEITEGTELS